MPNTYTPISASGSTRGRIIQIAASATPGTILHTVSTTATDFDYISIWAWNKDTIDRTLNLEFGGTGTTDRISYIIEAGKPPYCIIDRWDIKGNSTADVVRCFGSVANQLFVKLVVYRVATV